VWLPPTLRTLVVADGMGPAVASRTPHVDPPPLTLATNRAGGDSATGTGPPAGSRPSAIPEQSSAPCTNVAGLQASPVRVARAARCWSAAVIVVAFGRVRHICLLGALVRDRTSRRPGRTIRVRQVMANAGTQ